MALKADGIELSTLTPLSIEVKLARARSEEFTFVEVAVLARLVRILAHLYRHVYSILSVLETP